MSFFVWIGDIGFKRSILMLGLVRDWKIDPITWNLNLFNLAEVGQLLGEKWKALNDEEKKVRLGDLAFPALTLTRAAQALRRTI